MIIIMLGAPGTGKGTVAGMLEKGIGIKQVSTGDIFRKNMQEGTEIGKVAESYISKGQLVPDEVTIKIVEERLNEKDEENGIILDGFPRTLEQAKALDKMLEEKNRKIDMVLNLVTPEEEIIERIVNRRICSNPECKTIYNVVMNPPKVEGIPCITTSFIDTHIDAGNLGTPLIPESYPFSAGIAPKLLIVFSAIWSNS